MSSELTVEAWAARYRPEYNFLSDGSSFGGIMFETYGDDLAYVENVSPRRVWTYVDTDEGDLAILSGFHVVNRIGYFVTEESWTEDVTVVFDEVTA